MLAIRMLRSRGVDDIVVWPDETECEANDGRKDEREDNGRNEGCAGKLYVISVSTVPGISTFFVLTSLWNGFDIKLRNSSVLLLPVLTLLESSLPLEEDCRGTSR